MSIVKEVTIFCDKCGRWGRFQTPLVREAEAIVKDSGWEKRKTKFGVRHICRQCVESRESGVEFEIWE